MSVITHHDRDLLESRKESQIEWFEQWTIDYDCPPPGSASDLPPFDAKDWLQILIWLLGCLALGLGGFIAGFTGYSKAGG
jgi:hypothetical protein